MNGRLLAPEQMSEPFQLLQGACARGTVSFCESDWLKYIDAAGVTRCQNCNSRGPIMDSSLEATPMSPQSPPWIAGVTTVAHHKQKPNCVLTCSTSVNLCVNFSVLDRPKGRFSVTPRRASSTPMPRSSSEQCLHASCDPSSVCLANGMESVRYSAGTHCPFSLDSPACSMGIKPMIMAMASACPFPYHSSAHMATLSLVYADGRTDPIHVKETGNALEDRVGPVLAGVLTGCAAAADGCHAVSSSQAAVPGEEAPVGRGRSTGRWLNAKVSKPSDECPVTNVSRSS